jgi:RNA recognition motif-containing protein
MPRTSTNLEIEGLFRPFGLVSSFVFTKDPVTGLNTGAGTIEMDSDVDAQSAIDRLNFTQYVVKLASPNDPKWKSRLENAQTYFRRVLVRAVGTEQILSSLPE